MNILIVVGSARMQGNTDKLAEAFGKGAMENGHQVTRIHLGKTRINPCLGCNVCRKESGCVQKDGFQEFASAFLTSDVVVLATPLYFWGMSAQLKAVIDRLYSLGRADPKGYYRYPVKKSVLLVTAADTEKHFWVFESVEQYYRRLVRYLRWIDLGVLMAGNCGGTKSDRCIGETGYLEQAYEFGRHL
ncbi:MAG: flavodoxin family protein [Lachnospiraceae bacterium]|nr:flavodoxin family protein [Lachnospiraceae bacterium]